MGRHPRRTRANLVLGRLDEQHPPIELIWLDRGYANTVDDHLIGWAAQHLVVKLEVVKRCDDMRGIQVLPRRWMVERVRREALIDRVEVRHRHLCPGAAGDEAGGA